MIIRGATLALVLGTSWREHYEIRGGAFPVRMDGGHRRILWSASSEGHGRVDFSISWVDRDGWHVHATSRGTASDLIVSAMWRDGGGVAVEVRTVVGGAPIELRRIDP